MGEEEAMYKKIFAIVKREFLTRAKTKGFIIGTLIFPLMLFLIFGGFFLVSKLFQPSTKTFYVVDETDLIFDGFVELLPDTLKNGMPKFRFIEQTITAESMEATIDEFQERVLNKEIDGYIIIPEDVVEAREVRYSARNVGDFEEQGEIRRAISRIVTNIRLERKGISADEIRREFNMGNVRLVSRQITDEGEIEKSGVSSYILTYILTYVLFLMMMIYGAMLMRSVIEEKSQRITEGIVSTVKPVELMMGKIVGISALGLTQLAVFGGIMVIVVRFAEPLFRKLGVSAGEVLQVIRQVQFPLPVFLFMLLFFLMGFIFYSALYAALGAMVNSEDEAQQMQFPLIFLFLFGYFMMLTVARNPDTARAFWISLIPPFTPLVMFTRVAVSTPIIPSGTYLSILTMLAAIVLMIMVTAKIYRVGILMYGKKATIKEAIKWLRYK